jgi:hypothetical protein
MNTNSSSQGSLEPKSNLPNLFMFLTFFTPYALIFFFLLLSTFGQNLKGVIYFIGVVLVVLTTKVFEPFVKKRGNLKHCYFFGPSFILDLPSISSAVYAYTFIYLFMSMIKTSILNIPLLIALLFLSGMDFVVRKQKQCTNTVGLILGSLIGILGGFLWYSFVLNTMGLNQIYFGEYISDKRACSRPSNQKFKCTMYKDGQPYALPTSS